MKHFSHNSLFPSKNVNQSTPKIMLEMPPLNQLACLVKCYRFTEWQSAARLETLPGAVQCSVGRFIWHNLAAGLNRNAVLCIVRQVLYHYFRLPIHHMPEAVLQLDWRSNMFLRVQVHSLFSFIWVSAEGTQDKDIIKFYRSSRNSVAMNKVVQYKIHHLCLLCGIFQYN